MLIHIEQVLGKRWTKETQKNFNPKQGGLYTIYPRQKG